MALAIMTPTFGTINALILTARLRISRSAKLAGVGTYHAPNSTTMERNAYVAPLQQETTIDLTPQK